ncbi:MAG: glycosyltransferase [Clostridia bacterium]|nr:glycosyltransferase [Clostridia bacterium]
MDVKVYALLVIHERDCAASPSCVALRRDRIPAVVVDNSVSKNNNYRYCANAGFAYRSMGGNRGLAVAYNAGIRYLRSKTDATHVMILDDDTRLPDGFFERTATAVAADPNAVVWLPRVMDERGLLSPCQIHGFHVSRLPETATPSQEVISGINSGMTIALSFFDTYVYDEGYFLDYIDHAFLRDVKATKGRIVTTEETLQQSFAGNTRGNKKAAAKRFHIFKQDFRRFCGRSIRGRLYAAYVIGRRRMRLWLKGR